MRKIHLLVISMFAVIAIGAVASASASAAECATLAKGGCVSVEKVLTLEEPNTLTKTAGTKTILAVVGIGEVECEKVEASGTLKSTEKEGVTVAPFKLKFSGNCKLIGHTGCKINKGETITTAEINGSIESITSGTAKVKFKPTSGETGEFATVNIEGCEQEAKIKVTGTQECKGLKAETEALTHELNCLKSESKLKDGTKEASFLGEATLTTTKKAAIFLEKF